MGVTQPPHSTFGLQAPLEMPSDPQNLDKAGQESEDSLLSTLTPAWLPYNRKKQTQGGQEPGPEPHSSKVSEPSCNAMFSDPQLFARLLDLEIHVAGLGTEKLYSLVIWQFSPVAWRICFSCPWNLHLFQLTVEVTLKLGTTSLSVLGLKCSQWDLRVSKGLQKQ